MKRTGLIYSFLENSLVSRKLGFCGGYKYRELRRSVGSFTYCDVIRDFGLMIACQTVLTYIAILLVLVYITLLIAMTSSGLSGHFGTLRSNMFVIYADVFARDFITWNSSLLNINNWLVSVSQYAGIPERINIVGNKSYIWWVDAFIMAAPSLAVVGTWLIGTAGIMMSIIGGIAFSCAFIFCQISNMFKNMMLKFNLMYRIQTTYLKCFDQIADGGIKLDMYYNKSITLSSNAAYIFENHLMFWAILRRINISVANWLRTPHCSFVSVT